MSIDRYRCFCNVQIYFFAEKDKRSKNVTEPSKEREREMKALPRWLKSLYRRGGKGGSLSLHRLCVCVCVCVCVYS